MSTKFSFVINDLAVYDGLLTAATPCRALSGALVEFRSVHQRGELAGWSRAASGHCYFTLKDAENTAALRCAMFRRAAVFSASLRVK